MIKYSIIIPTANRAKILKDCLCCISKLNKTINEFEVLIMDNGKPDITKNVVELFKNKIPNLQYFHLDTPGLHISRNKAAQIANGEILCYVDDDSFVSKNWLTAIEKTFNNPDIILATGRISPKYETTPTANVLQLWEHNNFGRVLYKYSLLELKNKFMQIPYGFVFGCNFIIRKDVVLEYKGFNPDGMPNQYILFRGDGENALTCKLNNAGISAYYNPKIAIKHFVSKNRMNENYMEYRALRSAISDGFKYIREKKGFLKYNQPCNECCTIKSCRKEERKKERKIPRNLCQNLLEMEVMVHE